MFGKNKIQECAHRICEKCGHLFREGGKEVEVGGSIFGGERGTEDYCSLHIPKWDYSQEYSKNGKDSNSVISYTRYFKHQPDIEVKENGKPIRKKK